MLLVVPRDGQVLGDVRIGNDTHAGPEGPEIQVEDPWEFVLVHHRRYEDLDGAVFREEVGYLAKQLEMAPEEGVGWFGLAI